MRALAYFLLAAAIILSVRFFLSRRRGWQELDREAYGSGQETSGASGWNSLTFELSARIFDPEDSDFVASEATQQDARQFRRERTALALDWLRTVCRQVKQLMRAHFRASRGNDDLKPAEEIRLWFDFLLFQLTSGILYLVIWISGPPRAAKLVKYSMELAGKVRDVTKDVLPAGRQVVAEIMNNRPEPGNGNAV